MIISEWEALNIEVQKNDQHSAAWIVLVVITTLTTLLIQQFGIHVQQLIK